MATLIDMIAGRRRVDGAPAVAARRGRRATAGASRPVSSPAGDWTLLGLWGEQAPCTWRCSTSVRARSPSSASTVRTARFPSVGALHPPAIRLERAIRDLYGLEPVGAARHAALARSRLLGCAASARRSADAAPATRALRVPAGRRREPAPDSGRSGARRHHRARTFPLHRQRRDRGAAGAAPRLRAQGHRGADGRRRPRPGGASSPAAPPATARSPMRWPSRAPSKRRSASRCRRARSSCAR